ncbi:cubilin-like isoform X2 [Haliotis rubra]|uniref:cubilin-like isoform X2 n=1 Tax=Haliotis rubra TaxID=36100 RepID=UPI001EE62878|nr:cubilin-like isoform X2 [Haliotis rubra]
MNNSVEEENTSISFIRRVELTRIHTMASQITAFLLLGILSPVLSNYTDRCFTDIHLSGVMETVTSPGFPTSYSSYVACLWRIHASSPEHLVGINYYASLEKSIYCRTGILSFYDDSSSKMLLRLCGSIPKIGSIISNGPTMDVHLLTGPATGGMGFLLNVTDVERCDGNLTATSEEGNLTSLDLTHSYFSNQKCTWIITAQNENETVKVTNIFTKEGEFGDFSTQCNHDVVRVYDGNTTEAGQLPGELCSTVGRTYYSSGNTLSVVFEKLTSEGVQLQYTAIPESDCNRTYYVGNDPVYIQSPGYPDTYGSDLKCVIFIFDLMDTPNLKLDVVNADIEGDYPQCDNDSVTVFGWNYGSYHPIGKFCGNSSISPVGPYYSNGRNLKLVFKSNSDTSGAGFQVVVSHTTRQVVPDQSENCGRRYLTATAYPEFLSSPGYPVLSPSNADCIWIIKASDPNMTVRIDVIDSDIPNDPIFIRQCGQNLGLLYDGPSMFDKFLLSWCGKTLPSLQSTGPDITVRFRARDAHNMTGIKVKYFATNEPWSCGGAVDITTDRERTLTASYEGCISKDCLWTIHAPTNTTIKVNVDAIIYFTSSSCNVNYLEIYDGNYDNGTSTTHGKWCGDSNADFISSGNVITARFQFNVSVGGMLTMILKAGHFNASRKTSLSASRSYKYFTSPNYPFSYPSNFESTWTIEGDEGYHVGIGVVFSSLEKSDGCQRDYMEAFDGADSSAPSLGRWCGSSEPRIMASSSVMFLKFKSNSHTVDRGFRILYAKYRYNTELPDTTSTGRQGVIIGSSVGGVCLLLIIVGAICGIVWRTSAIKRQPDASNKAWTMSQRPEDAIIPAATFSSPETFNLESKSSK